MTTEPTRVLFVCLGNICRSPLAEGIFLHLASQRGALDRFHVDSAGTGGWHAGNPADPRSIAVAKQHGVHLPSRARQVRGSEADQWDIVLAMDAQNRADLIELGFDSNVVKLMRGFEPAADDTDVPDPYYGGDDGFENVYRMLLAACDGLLDQLVQNTDD